MENCRLLGLQFFFAFVCFCRFARFRGILSFFVFLGSVPSVFPLFPGWVFFLEKEIRGLSPLLSSGDLFLLNILGSVLIEEFFD